MNEGTKLVIMCLLASVLIGLSVIAIYQNIPKENIKNFISQEKKAVAKIMYSAPIGPTQEAPYILPSKYIGDNK